MEKFKNKAKDNKWKKKETWKNGKKVAFSEERKKIEKRYTKKAKKKIKEVKENL